MSGNTAKIIYNNAKIIPFSVIQGGMNSATDDVQEFGKESEVYAFRSNEEIEAMINVFDKHIENATSKEQKRIAHRNKLLFVIGINIGIRASDLRALKWSFFFDEQDGKLEFKTMNKFKPMKQRKQNKFVKPFFNETIETAINKYMVEYPIVELDKYIFNSRKGNKPIEVDSIRKIIKEAAAEAGINQNIGSHSLRKTWAFHCWHNAEDKNKALVTLQQCFNHSNTLVTMKYIGLMDDEISDMYNSVNLGLEFI